MTDAEVLDPQMRSWLQSSIVDLDGAQLERRMAAARAIAPQLVGERAVHCVLAAFGSMTDDGRTFLSSAVADYDDEFDPSGKDGLLKRVACCSVALILASERTDTGMNDGRLLTALLVQATRFGGLSAVIAPLCELADACVSDEARARRDVAAPDTKLRASVVRKANKIATLAEDSTPADVNVALNDVRDLVVHLAEKTEAVIDARRDIGQAFAEELEMLWWSYSRVSATESKPWDCIEPLPRRVVLAARELAERTQTPGPQSSIALLSLVLGSDAETEIALRDLCEQLAGLTTQAVAAPAGAFLPLHFGAAEHRSAPDANAWRTIVMSKTTVDPDSPRSAIDLADQLVREQGILGLL